VTFIVPPPIAKLDLTMSDDAAIRVRRHGNVEGPRFVLSHGNGFATDAYYPFWRYLLPDFDVIIFDQRNHGQNAFHPSGHTQIQMADDMETILRAVETQFGKRTTIGAFHSLSTTVSLLHAARFGYRWDALILFDPPLAPPPGHRLHKAARDFELALHDWARKRKHKFKDTDELARYFQGTRRLRRWVPGAADLMARAITRRSSDGGVELVCPGELEAEIYKQNSASPAWSVLPSVAKEIFMISSDFNSPDADPPGLVSQSLQTDFGIKVVPVPDTGHLLQIERPEEVAKIVREYLHSRSIRAG
jgi:pimeloyl-ACP methyl ester carboxylesterase